MTFDKLKINKIKGYLLLLEHKPENNCWKLGILALWKEDVIIDAFAKYPLVYCLTKPFSKRFLHDKIAALFQKYADFFKGGDPRKNRILLLKNLLAAAGESCPIYEDSTGYKKKLINLLIIYKS